MKLRHTSISCYSSQLLPCGGHFGIVCCGNLHFLFIFASCFLFVFNRTSCAFREQLGTGWWRQTVAVASDDATIKIFAPKSSTSLSSLLTSLYGLQCGEQVWHSWSWKDRAPLCTRHSWKYYFRWLSATPQHNSYFSGTNSADISWVQQLVKIKNSLNRNEFIIPHVHRSSGSKRMVCLWLNCNSEQF